MHAALSVGPLLLSIIAYVYFDLWDRLFETILLKPEFCRNHIDYFIFQGVKKRDLLPIYRSLNGSSYLNKYKCYVN